MSFTYSIAHLDFSKITSETDLLALLEAHDPDSFLYCVHTAHLNYAIAKELRIAEEDLSLYFKCGLFHDTGKLGMSYEFLNYAGAYSIHMYKEMKKHPSGGGTILSKMNAHQFVIETAKYHHCNFDGSGYPGGLYGKDIPLHARLTRATDSIDAYMSKRCYKEGGPVNGVLDDLKHYNGTSYDPEIIEAFEIVHKKVMRECHKFGHDHPSQTLYMHYLMMHYPNTCEEEIMGRRVTSLL